MKSTSRVDPKPRFSPTVRKPASVPPNALIHAIRASALREECWQPAIQQLCSFVGGQQLILYSGDALPGDPDFFWASNSIPVESQSTYAEYYWRHDLWNQALRSDPRRFISGCVQLDGDIVDGPTFSRSVFRNEFLNRLDIHHCVGSVLNADRDQSLPPLYLSVFSSPKSTAFSDNDAERLASVVPHLQDALRLSYVLRRASAPVQAGCLLFESSPDVVILVDAGARLVSATEGARALLARGHIAFEATAGRLAFRDAAADEMLRRFVWKMTATDSDKFIPSEAVAVPLGRGEGVTVIRASSLPEEHPFLDGRRRACAVITVHGHARQSPQLQESLMTLFRLTKAECKVIEGVLDGPSSTEIAERLGLSSNTINTQMRSVYRKLNINKQGDVVRICLLLME